MWDLATLTLMRVYDFEDMEVHTLALRGGPDPLLIAGSYFGEITVRMVGNSPS